jgi:CelD/BcsL family acetyltransferase involved in cellulose biosynthesis
LVLVIYDLEFFMTLLATKIKPVATYISSRPGSTELLVGKDVINLLEEIRFLGEWNQLYQNCSWATVFQSPSFVATWYRIYQHDFVPVLIKNECAGKLTGLLTLAIDKKGLITGAGANQAEYQVWLTADANDETFFKNALVELRRFFPGKKVLLKYIPAGVSLVFTKKDPTWKKRCFVKTSPQAIMTIDEAHCTNELKKKNRREKVNRLKRLGALTFERISDYKKFDSVFDELSLQSDFRKGALYNKVAFKTDPLRKQFLLSLFVQNNLHATVLKLNDKIIAANVSMGGKGQLHLQGINSFDAAYARYSPGIIHFLMLGKLLAQEGVNVFDLTPGADGYKDTLATDYTVAHTLSIGNAWHRLINNLQSGLNRYFKNTAARLGVQPGTLKKWRMRFTQQKEKFMHVAKQGSASWPVYVFNQVKWQSKAKKCWVVQKPVPASGLLPVQKDDLNELLEFDPHEVRYSRQEFLAGAMRRFEEGAHCYSWAEEGRLLGCAWITYGKPDSTEPGNGDDAKGAPFSLCGLYVHRKGRKRLPLFLQSVANELAVNHAHDKIYIITNCNEDLQFEKAGFIRSK